MSGCYVRQNPAVERSNEGMGEKRKDKDGRTEEKWILEPLSELSKEIRKGHQNPPEPKDE